VSDGLEEAVAAARTELSRLEAEQGQRRARAGLDETVRALSAENEALSTARSASLARLEPLTTQVREAQAAREAQTRQLEALRAMVARLEAVMRERQRPR
jgi:chromosome segregation ATPase